MRTRKTSRKKINLPGRYSTGLGEPHDVLLRDLSTGGCRFEAGQRRLRPGAPLQIYIAGTGPHRAIVKWVADNNVGIGFVMPLSEDQFGRFQASHIPDSADMNTQADFDDLSDVKPQRFC